MPASACGRPPPRHLRGSGCPLGAMSGLHRLPWVPLRLRPEPPLFLECVGHRITYQITTLPCPLRAPPLPRTCPSLLFVARSMPSIDHRCVLVICGPEAKDRVASETCANRKRGKLDSGWGGSHFSPPASSPHLGINPKMVKPESSIPRWSTHGSIPHEK